MARNVANGFRRAKRRGADMTANVPQITEECVKGDETSYVIINTSEKEPERDEMIEHKLTHTIKRQTVEYRIVYILLRTRKRKRKNPPRSFAAVKV